MVARWNAFPTILCTILPAPPPHHSGRKSKAKCWHTFNRSGLCNVLETANVVPVQGRIWWRQKGLLPWAHYQRRHPRIQLGWFIGFDNYSLTFQSFNWHEIRDIALFGPKSSTIPTNAWLDWWSGKWFSSFGEISWSRYFPPSWQCSTSPPVSSTNVHCDRLVVNVHFVWHCLRSEPPGCNRQSDGCALCFYCFRFLHRVFMLFDESTLLTIRVAMTFIPPERNCDLCKYKYRLQRTFHDFSARISGDAWCFVKFAGKRFNEVRKWILAMWVVRKRLRFFLLNFSKMITHCFHMC